MNPIIFQKKSDTVQINRQITKKDYLCTMIIAQQKRKENIVEYLLYMWQVEDLIRACHFDMEEIEQRVISQYHQPEEVKANIRQWYNDLIRMMQAENVTEKGHIKLNEDIIASLDDLHSQLLKDARESVYHALYYKTLPSIVQLRAKSGGQKGSEMETCLTAVYGFILLKMQGKEISSETLESVKQISSLLAFVAAKYHDFESQNEPL